MAKKQFRNLRDLQKYVEQNVVPRMYNDGDIETILKGAMNQAIYEVVYGAYYPNKYKRRRGDGGLGDTRIMQITDAILMNGNFHIVFENLAEGNDTLSNERLDSTIIEGIESNWEQTGEWSEPRDFITDMALKLRQNPKPLIDAVKKAFIREGFKIK